MVRRYRVALSSGGCSKTQKLPLILFIHGGPVAQDEWGFDLTRQMLAAGGYAVAAVNYRGSNGRGLAYCKAISGDWGNKEVLDLHGAVDYLVAQGIADSAKLGVGGWSYGGILTDYLISADTRFKAAASGAGTALHIATYGTDQYIRQYEVELGTPWKIWTNGFQISSAIPESRPHQNANALHGGRKRFQRSGGWQRAVVSGAALHKTCRRNLSSILDSF